MRVILGCLLLHFVTLVNAQTIDFSFNDGNTSSYNLDDVRKITFDSDIMNLHLLDGNIYSWNIGAIGHYEYNEGTVQLIELINKMNVKMFPNPSADILNITYFISHRDKVSLDIYDSQGQLIIVKNIGPQSEGINQITIDVGDFKTGNYSCRLSVGNLSVVKKMIKQ